MDSLSYKTLEGLGYDGYILKEAPEKVLQFGEGNFLRAFADHWIDLLNEKAGFNGKAILIMPRGRGRGDTINAQDGLYTLLLRGQENGEKISRKRVISSVSECLNPYADFSVLLNKMKQPELRFIISNTTEAGIVFDESCKLTDMPPASFPAKLTALLYERFKQGLNGFVILPCELIDNNGAALKKCVHEHISLWGLEDDFSDWIDKENIFCSTLVDRIVPGYPKEEAEDICRELGYNDELLVSGEVFGSWVIEGPISILDELPVKKAGLSDNIIVVSDVAPYKQRKVRILNGAHTGFALAAYLTGEDIVRDCMNDEVIHGFIERLLYDEVIPTIDLPQKELMGFTLAVEERFLNPYVDHQLLSISLNSVSKWKARCMPSLAEYAGRYGGELPNCLCFSFAALIDFYRHGKEKGEDCLIGRRGKDVFEIKDDQWILDFFYEHRDDDNDLIAHAVISNTRMWDDTLIKLKGFEETIVRDLDMIDRLGMREAMREIQK